MPTVLLVRHAQASFGSEDYDELSPLGREQTEVLTEALLARGMNVTRLLAGNCRRHLETARPLAAKLDLELELDPRFNEYETDAVLAQHASSGVSLDGTGEAGRAITSEEFQFVLDGALDRWVAGEEGSGGMKHTWRDFQAAATGALTALAASLGGGETGVAFTSGGTIAAIGAHLLGEHADLFTRLNRVTVNTSITKLAVGRRGISLISFNDHAHIDLAGGMLTYR